MVNLLGKPIVITGASSGIGAATALACARAGMPVALGARRAQKLAAIRDQILALGGRAVVVETDVTAPAECDRLVNACVEAFGGVYAVYANAGYGDESPLHEMSDERVRAMFETNFFGSLNIIRPALARMLERSPQPGEAVRGHVLWCSSCLARMTLPRYSIYSATKAAQAHCATAMRHELRPLGVWVSSVHPIGTATEFSDQVTARVGGTRKTIQTPSSLKQTPEFVAQCTVRELRSPRGEVWTGLKGWATRIGMGAATMLPGVSDWALRRVSARRESR